MNWKVGDRCKLVFPAQMQYYGFVGTLIEIFPEGELVKTQGFDGQEFLEWADCMVCWDNDGLMSPQTLEQLAPLTPPKPPLVKWEDMPCNPDGSYKEKVYAL